MLLGIQLVLVVYIFVGFLSKQGKRADDPRTDRDPEFFGSLRKKRRAVGVKPRQTAKRASSTTVGPISVESSDDGDVAVLSAHVRDTNTELNLSQIFLFLAKSIFMHDSFSTKSWFTRVVSDILDALIGIHPTHTLHVYVRIDDVSEPEIDVAPSASIEIPLSWVVSDDEDGADAAPGAEPDSVPPDSDHRSSSATAAAEIESEEFILHVNTEGHRAICSIILPLLLSVMRDNEYKHRSPRDQVRRACDRRTPDVSYVFTFSIM